MPTTPTLLAFAAAAFALVVIPGPNLIYIITRGIQQGRRAAVVSSLGVQLGMVVHIVLATFGLSALVAKSPVLYDLIRYAGAAYLVWMGISLLRKRHASVDVPVEVRPASMRRIFVHGLAINLLNPKVILFVLALLPQFVDPARGSTSIQMLVLGSVMIIVALISDTTYAIASGSVGEWLKRHPGSDRHRDRASGLVYLMLGLVVALTGSGSGKTA
ncbi:MAG TPA: LysE family translocator [Thermomicrobiales bacterium]|nr:LysE family translocator [Thermomicrobiales bacterium]